MCAAMVERDPGLNSFNDDRYYSQGGQQNMSFNQDYQQGLRIGNYSDRRRVLDYERHKEYNVLLKEKKEQEARRLDEVYGRRSHAPEKPELFDYKKQQQQNYEEKKKEYQEFLKKKEAESHMKKPPSPPSIGLDIGKHDMMRKQQQQAMQELYRSQLDEQKNQELWNAQKRTPTPPVGLNILTQEERRRRDEARKKVYREELLMQQKEQMLSKAQHQIEVPRFNGSPQRTSSQPPLESSRPPPQEYDRMPPPEYSRRSRDGPMSSMEQQISNDHAYEDRKQQLMREIGVDKEARDRQYRDMFDRDTDARDIHAQEFHRHDEQLRDKNIMEYLEKKRIEEERQFNHPRKKKLGPDSIGQMDESYDPGRYEEMRHRLQDETHQEYKKELAKGPKNDIKYGLPIGQWRYDPQIKQREMERNKEYNEFLKSQKKKNPEHPKRNLNKRPDSGKDPAKNPSKQIGYMAYPGAREHDRKREERPYNGYAPEPKGRPSINPIGQPIWIEDRDKKDYQPSWYNQEVAPVGLATPNKDEYRQPRERLGSYNHRDYVRDSPTYQEMLESKRRHEAAYRRYDDPGLNHYPQTGQSDPVNNQSPRRF